MKYLAILGRQPEFGLVELESLLGADKIEPFGPQTAIIAESPILNHLGGTQKIGRVIYQGKSADLNSIDLAAEDFPMQKSKTPFGLSYYGLRVSNQFVVASGLELKKRLKHRGSLRYVAPKAGLELTAAQLKFNNIIHEGFELLVAFSAQKMVVAITEQVQDIDWYSQRDYGRPARSPKVGMLPPKLAQIMINTSRSKLIYDPFCGTGVVLQEALLMGRQAIGSDIEPDLVQSTTENLEWLQQQLPGKKLASWSVNVADAQTLILPDKPLAVVSEGYLGPNQSTSPNKNMVQQLKQTMTPLITISLQNWARQLPTGTDVALATPHWKTNNDAIGLDIIDHLPGLDYTLKDFEHVDSKNLIYRRPDQYVGRQLLLLTKR